jgi:hypothetical protein
LERQRKEELETLKAHFTTLVDATVDPLMRKVAELEEQLKEATSKCKEL